MDTEFIQQAMRLFLAAVDLPVAEQEPFLAQECGNHDLLREHVRDLLLSAQDDRPDDPVAPAARRPRTTPDGVAAGVELGDYVLRKELGRGGMGVVWLADQKSLRRPVALKLVRPSLATPDLIRRFEREAAILGRLQHPGIAGVYAIGSAALGPGGAGGEQHFFAMEYVEGTPLDTYVEQNHLEIDQRLRLLADVCDAVEHAHRQGVIHRDLKPDNILVTAAGVPKVLDFGIARATSSDVMTMTMQTAVGQLIGTVPYMSPEQVLGDSSLIDARSDIYALGVLLYKLLSGRLPADVQGRSIPEATRIIRDDEPTRLGTIATTCRGDIDTIVHKALEKDRERRYPSAGDLAADIRRYLANEPIVARPASTFYQLRKFARRNRGLVAGLAATFVALAVGVVVAATLAVQANRNAAAFERAAYSQSLMVAAAAIADHDVSTAERALMASPARLRGWEWDHLSSRLDLAVMALELPEDADRAGSPWFSADGNTLSLWTMYGIESGGHAHRWALQSWDLTTGARLAPSAAVDVPSGCRRVTVREPGWGYDDGVTVHLFGDGPGRKLRLPRASLLPDSGHVDNFAFTAEGDHLCWATYTPGPQGEGNSRSLYNRQAWIGAVVGGEIVSTRLIGSGLTGAIRADGRRASVLPDLSGGFAVWDHTSGLTTLRGHSDVVGGFACNSDWSLVATGSRDGTIRMWDPETGAQIACSPRLGDSVNSVVLRDDGTLLASSSDDGLIRLWDAPGLGLRATLHGHRSPRVFGLTLSPDGGRLASIPYGGNEYVRVWDTAVRGDPWALEGHTSYVYGLATRPDGRVIASGSWDGTVRLWDADALVELAVLEGHRDWVGGVAFSPDGTSLAAVGNDRRLLVWDVSDPRNATLRFAMDDYELHPLAPITWHPNGEQLLVAMGEDSVRVFDCGDERDRTKPLSALREYRSGLVSPDSTRFVRFGLGSGNSLFELSTYFALCATDSGRELARVPVDSNGFKFAFSPAGKGDSRLLVPFEMHFGGRQVQHGWRLLDATTGAQLAERVVGHSATLAVAFSPDGKRFATGGHDRSISVWDSEEFSELVQLSGHSYYVFRLAFSPDGGSLYSAGGDGDVRVWSTKPLRDYLQARQRK